MRFFYRFYMKGTMARGNEPRLGGTQKGRKMQKEKVVHPMRPRNLKNQIKTSGKRNVDHLEGEFKKIKPNSFDGEPKIGEEAEERLLDIKKYL